MAALPVLTVICPVFNEEATVPLFFERMNKVFAGLANQIQCQLIFVDNCSQDRTRAIVGDLCRTHSNVYLIALSRNFGYQCSIECGLKNARGDLFTIIDVDCEDPPELIPEFLKYWRDGFDIVYGERLDREEAEIIKMARRIFYRLTRLVADDYFILDMAEFSLLTAEVRDAIAQDNNSFPFIRASIGRAGFRRKNIPYKRQRRVAGETHYNLWRMTVFAVAGILSSSTYLLRFPAYAFLPWLLLMFGMTVAAVTINAVWALPLLVFFGFSFCGLALISISIYIARIYKNGLLRPNYLIKVSDSLLPSGFLDTYK